MTQSTTNESSEINTKLDDLIKKYKKYQSSTRWLTYLNLSIIISIIIGFAYLINSRFDQSNETLKSYQNSSNVKAKWIDSLYNKNIILQTTVLNKLNLNRESIIKSHSVINHSDSVVIELLDSARQTLLLIESSAKKMEDRSINSSKEFPIIYFQIFLIVAFTIAIITVWIYLIKVFVNIHRYNSILADHYDALEGAFELLKNKNIFGDSFDLDKAYNIVHPNKDKFIEINTPVDMNPSSISEGLTKALLDKFTFTPK